MGIWRKFGGLAPDEQRLVIAAAVLLPVIGAMLRLVGFARCQSALTAVSRPRGDVGASVESFDRARSSARLIRAAAQHGCYHATCLPQSLLLWSLLKRRGVDPVLRVGVRKTDGYVKAHAWVEYQGMAVNDDADVHEQFSAFDRVSAR